MDIPNWTEGVQAQMKRKGNFHNGHTPPNKNKFISVNVLLTTNPNAAYDLVASSSHFRSVIGRIWSSTAASTETEMKRRIEYLFIRQIKLFYQVFQSGIDKKFNQNSWRNEFSDRFYDFSIPFFRQNGVRGVVLGRKPISSLPLEGLFSCY